MAKRQYPFLLGLSLLGGAAAGAALSQFTKEQRNRPTFLVDDPAGTALITGASSGIGSAYARRLAALGMNLILAARREEKLAALAEDLQTRHGIRAGVLAADLSQADDIERVENRLATTTDLKLLINNAGFGTTGHFIDVDYQQQLDMLRLHVEATTRLCRAALPQLLTRREGAIINVSSIAAFFAVPGGATYAATKLYLIRFSEILQAEVAGSGIRVQALCPGFTHTEFHDSPAFADFDKGSIPSYMWMTPEDTVEASLKALSTGKVIVIPGLPNQALIAASSVPLVRKIIQAARQQFNRLTRQP